MLDTDGGECDPTRTCCDGLDNDDDTSIDEADECVVHAGWYFDLPISGERMVSDVLLRGGKVIVITFVPEQTPCGSGGDSVIMELDACTGGRLDEPQLDITEDSDIDSSDLISIEGIGSEIAPTGMQNPGRLLPPAILRMPGAREMKYFSSSRGTIATVLEQAVQLGMTYWKEVENE